MDWFALALVFVAALLGGAGIAGYLERRHSSSTARAARLFAARYDAYAAAAVDLERVRASVARTLPIMTPMPEPPDPPTEEDWREMRGRLLVVASDGVLDALEATRVATVAMYGQVITVQGIERQLGAWGDRPARAALEPLRAEALASIDVAEEAMRAELLGL